MTIRYFFKVFIHNQYRPFNLGKNVVEVEVSEPKVKPNVQCIGVEVYHKGNNKNHFINEDP